MSNELRLNEQTRNHLINLVKPKPILYDDSIVRSQEGHEGRDDRIRIWNEIGQVLSLPGTDWNNACYNEHFIIFLSF